MSTPATSSSAAADRLCSFFERLPSFDAVVRALLSEAELSVELCFRAAPDRRVLLDLTCRPARVSVADPTRSGRVRVAVDSELMHDIMLGKLSAGVAFGRRQLLLRGSAFDIARLIPLFDFAPLLYREHLADLGVHGFARPSGYAPQQHKESLKMTARESDQPPLLPAEQLSRLERALFAGLNRTAYALGYSVGTLRHRLLPNLSLFEVLSAMSKGLDAAQRGS